MVCFHLIAFVCWTFVWSSNGGYSDNSSDIFISFTSTSDIKYVNSYAGTGHFGPYATVFKDTTQESRTSDSLYYFISDVGGFTDQSEWPVLMMSTIYDSNANVFSNDENVISAQIPYQVFAANQSYAGDGTQGYGLLSCTNGNTFDIIICYNIQENLNPMVYCLIFFNNYLTPKWSNPIPVINNTIPIDFLKFTLECVHDGYLILFQAHTPIENDKPNTLYTLLDLDGNFVINSRALFDENVFNFTTIFPCASINSHQNNVNSMSVNSKNTQILVSLCMGHPRSIGAFYLEYTNKSDINPLSVNYETSGSEFVLITIGDWLHLSGLAYYEMDSSINCCYMTSYLVLHYESDPINFYAELYVSIIDGNGNKLFKNDTLIETIDHSLVFTKNASVSSQIHGLNVNGSDENVFYFGVVITTYQDIFVRTFYIDIKEKVLVSMETSRLISIDDLPNIDFGFTSVYVDSQLKYNENEMFFVYQALTYDSQIPTSEFYVFAQSYNYSAH